MPTESEDEGGPLTYATLEELIDEVRRRCKLLIIRVVPNEGSTDYCRAGFYKGEYLEVLGLMRLCEHEFLTTLQKQMEQENRENGG